MISRSYSSLESYEMVLILRSVISPIRAKVDEVYRKLHQLCDVLEGTVLVSHDPNPHRLRISESNELLDGLRKLFVESDTDEQIRLMTIAPKEWGRQKIEKWYVLHRYFINLLAFCQSSTTMNFFIQVSSKTESGSTISCSPKRQRNVGLSAMFAREHSFI